MPISEDNKKYAEKIKDELIKNEIRTEIDLEDNTIEYKIREAQMQKIPYMIVVGDKEEKSKTVAVRSRDGKVKYKVKVEDFIEHVLDEAKRKTL